MEEDAEFTFEDRESWPSEFAETYLEVKSYLQCSFNDGHSNDCTGCLAVTHNWLRNRALTARLIGEHIDNELKGKRPAWFPVSEEETAHLD